MLDVSGSSIISGDLTIRGTYYGDSSSNIKIGGVGTKTNGNVPTNSSYTTIPTTNLKLTIDNESIYLQNLSGSVVNYGGYVLESTTGFNPYTYLANGNSTFKKNGSSLPNILINENGDNFTGLSSNNLFYVNYKNDGIDSFSLQFPATASTMNLISSTLYKYNSSGQTINLYLRLHSSAAGPTDYVRITDSYTFQKVASITIAPPVSIIPINSTYLGANIKYLSDIDTSTSTAIGYGANIDVSNQIVLGTSGEFVCIPSNRGLSIGKTTAPTSGYALDVSGQMRINNGVFAYDGLGYNVSLFSIVPNPSSSGYYLGYQVKTGYNSIGSGIPPSPSDSNNFGNTAIGAAALNGNTTGSGNTAIGARSLYNNTSGYYNTSIGGDSLLSNITGNHNVSIGIGSSYNHITGSYNTSIGDNAGQKDVSGNNNTFIGSYADISSNYVIENSTAIGYGAKIDVSNQIVLGTSGEFVCIPGYRGLSIGKKTAPTNALDVSGSINFSGNLYQNGSIFVSGSGGGGTSNSITGDFFVSGDISGNGDLFVRGSVEAASYNATSDYRIKDNVRNLDEEDTISNLRPVKYLNKQTNKQDFGLIAHELQSEYPDLVSGEKDGQELQSVNYIGLISVLIKEVQELKRITAAQAIEISTFRKG
jgi:hypothetical protein